jgi:hypothetical protein
MKCPAGGHCRGTVHTVVAAAVMGGQPCCTCAATPLAVLTFGMTELIRHAVTYFESSHWHRWSRPDDSA